MDSIGNEQWHTWHNMPNGLMDIQPDPFGGYIACGGGGTSYNPYNVFSLDDSGNTRWQRNYGVNPGLYTYRATSVVTMQDSNYLVSSNGEDWHIMKLDRVTGDTIWTRITYPASYGGISSLVNNENGTYIGLGWHKLYLFDSNGDTIWTRDYAWNQNFFPHVLKKTMDGGYAYSGRYTANLANELLIAFVKTDSSGNTVFTSVFTPENNFQPLIFYPNPASNEIWLSPASLAAEKKLLFTLIDLQGRIILQQQYDAAKPVEVSTVPEGLYIATLRGKEKEVRGKVVVQR